MSIEIKISPFFHQYTSNQQVARVNGSTIGECLDDLVKQFPRLKQVLFDKKGKMKDARVVSCTTPGWGFEQAVLAASLESKLSGHGEREITVKATLKFKLQSR